MIIVIMVMFTPSVKTLTTAKIHSSIGKCEQFKLHVTRTDFLIKGGNIYNSRLILQVHYKATLYCIKELSVYPDMYRYLHMQCRLSDTDRRYCVLLTLLVTATHDKYSRFIWSRYVISSCDGHHLLWEKVVYPTLTLSSLTLHCHLHPLQAANCWRNSLLAVDEDDLMSVKK